MAICGALAACSDSPKVEPSQRAQAPAASRTIPEVQAPKPKRTTLTRADLQQLLDAWLAAQNAGDFAAYAALYAPGMHGVKRVGERESRMDRAQWMQDRARMFKKKMEVEVHSVTFRSLMATAVIEFVQVFHSGKFMDSGPKKLTVALQDGEPRILHEEMLRSEVVFAAEAFRGHVHVAFRLGDATYVVLEQKADLSWGEGAFADRALPEGQAAYVQAVDANRIPRAQHWLATELRVFDDEGTPCSARIEQLELMLLVDGFTLSEEDEERVSKLDAAAEHDARARAILREEPAMLVGKLSTCGAGVAVPAREREPAFYLEQASDPVIERAAIDATKALPQYADLQAQWEKTWRGLSDDWKTTDRPGNWGGEGSVALFGAAGGARFALVDFGNDAMESEMPETLCALFRIDAQGKPALLRVSSRRVVPTLLLDLNADGVPEVMSNEELYVFGSYGLALIQEVHYAYNGCTC